MSFSVKIKAVGSYVPGKIVSNQELSRLFPPNRLPLIEEKTGICARRHVSVGEYTSSLAENAALDCLMRGGVSALDVDAIVLATSTPDRLVPATAAKIQRAIGARNSFACDLNSVCSGAIFAIDFADSMIRAAKVRNVLVIAADTYSRYLNPKDFSTYPYFGDGAGAILLAREDSAKGGGILRSALNTDGTGYDEIQIPLLDPSALRSDEIGKNKNCYFTMNGKAVFDFATKRGSEVLIKLLKDSKLSVSDVTAVIAHQANINVIRAISAKSGIEMEKFFINLNLLGNTASASVLIALSDWCKNGGGNSGEHVFLIAFGGGLSWGGIHYQF